VQHGAGGSRDRIYGYERKEKDVMAKKYDAPRDILAKDVEGILDKLRSIGALDE